MNTTVAAMPRGWRAVGPGLYLDADGALHMSVPELLALFGVADTPENRQVCVEQARLAVAEAWPETAVEVGD